MGSRLSWSPRFRFKIALAVTTDKYRSCFGKKEPRLCLFRAEELWTPPTPPPVFGTRGCKLLITKDGAAKKRGKRLQVVAGYRFSPTEFLWAVFGRGLSGEDGTSWLVWIPRARKRDEEF